MAPATIYQLRVFLRGISPLIWRRLLLCGDHTLADLHYVLQIVFGWNGEHLHGFRLHGREYSVSGWGGPLATSNARTVSLDQLELRPRERFFYVYDFSDAWVHELRIEQITDSIAGHRYPVCIAGNRAGPPEDCGGSWAYLEQRQRYNPGCVVRNLGLVSDPRTDSETREEARAELAAAMPWILVDHFDRRVANRRLQQYAGGDAGWQDDMLVV